MGYYRFCLQFFDETLDPKVADMCRLVHRIDPQVCLMITIPQARRQAVECLVDAGMNIFVCHAPRLGYDNAPDGFDLLHKDGRQLWFDGAADATSGDGKEATR